MLRRNFVNRPKNFFLKQLLLQTAETHSQLKLIHRAYILRLNCQSFAIVRYHQSVDFQFVRSDVPSLW